MEVIALLSRQDGITMPNFSGSGQAQVYSQFLDHLTGLIRKIPKPGDISESECFVNIRRHQHFKSHPCCKLWMDEANNLKKKM